MDGQLMAVALYGAGAVCAGLAVRTFCREMLKTRRVGGLVFWRVGSFGGSFYRARG